MEIKRDEYIQKAIDALKDFDLFTPYQENLNILLDYVDELEQFIARKNWNGTN